MAAVGSVKKACVTGASGFIASHLTAMLLERGYFVNGTVRSLGNPAKVDHLRALPGAAERLELFEADLLRPGSFDAAVAGCSVLFHTASPFFLSKPADPEEELVRPAREGTTTVLDAAARAGVGTVVVTSSMAAVMGKAVGGGHVWSERDWSDPERQRARQGWYFLSKTEAELAAWDLHEARGRPFRLATVQPTFVSGPMLQPSLNESSDLLAAFVTGRRSEVPTGCLSLVDVRDTALVHILAAESDAAGGTREEALATGKGRFTAVAESVPWRDAVAALRAALPEDLAARVPAFEGEVSEEPTRYDTSTTTALGLEWRGAAEMIADTARSDAFLAAVRAELAEA